MRSGGQVRFIKVSSRVQIGTAAIVGGLFVVLLATLATMTIGQYSSTRDRMNLLDREAKVANAEHEVSAYRKDLDAVAADLNRRQDFIEKMAETYFSDISAESNGHEKVEAGAKGNKEADRRVDQVSAALPEAAELARVEARQLAFVERLTHFAERRSANATQAIRKLGLNPGIMFTGLSDTSARGGPFISLATSSNGSIDPRFRRLGASLAQMNALEQGLAGIPQVSPANGDFISSSFGYRSDPFTGEGAFHAGLDFPGTVGAPIYAAANGKVVFAGVRQGYGRCIEIDHGNGLVTRYAHMSRLGAQVGQKVDAGRVIGAIGSSGRSTGPHLHFEVRIHDRPVNPRPFLEAATHVHQETHAGTRLHG